ncbi:MAG: hypothetical protein CFH19_00329 [Alphaproteobacteria bacterium MarineAlpha5_Bin9]|nr:MAG: hypothetical protein CFH19_00329 [Alphaproteobacteria bacterium MarineAlpha5_Bin9]
MKEYFINAIYVGYYVLLILWLLILIFIYLRKPPNSKLTLKYLIYSLLVFLILYGIIYLFS